MIRIKSTIKPPLVERFGVPVPEGMELEFVNFPCSDDELIESVKDADILWVSPVDVISKKVIDSIPNLKLIQSLGVAFDKIDLDAAKERGVYVCNNKAVNAASVAEHSVGLMLSALKRLPYGDSRIKKGEFGEAMDDSRKVGHFELGTRTVGLIGLGAIGKCAAKYLHAFGSNLYYYDVIQADSEFEKQYGLKFATLDELYKNCDILAYYVPVLDSTRGMVNKNTIAKMKKDVIIINVSRGEIVNNEDLRDALNDGKVVAGLDVIAPEPPAADHPLITLNEIGNSRLSVTPHIAGTTNDAFTRMSQWSYDNMVKVVAGETPNNVVNELK